MFREVSDQIFVERVLDFKIRVGKGMDHLVEDSAGFFDGQLSGLEHQGFDGDIAHVKGVQKLFRHFQVFQVRQKILLIPDHVHVSRNKDLPNRRGRERK